jgi:hypothetical protein
MIEVPVARAKRRAPWRGRRRVADPKNKPISVRCTAKDHALIDKAATDAELSIGAYLRSLALGSAGRRAVRRPPADAAELARILAELGKIGSNVNQLAHAYNQLGAVPGYPEIFVIRRDLAEMRAALMKALGYDHQG